MNGHRRSEIYKGQRVSIVLKEDQGTGRRTKGEVSQILSPGEFHPRGIKVRLKNGQVGRVQEILPQSKSEEELLNEAVSLVVLLVQKPDMSLYTRRSIISSGDEVLALGLDSVVHNPDAVKEVVGKLYSQVTSKLEEPRLIYNDEILLYQRKVNLIGYFCMGVDVKDAQRHNWDWTGWFMPDQLESFCSRGDVSEESTLLFEALMSEESPI